MLKTYTEKRFFKWCEDEISVSLRNKSGSYGGGSEVFVITDENCNALPAAMGMGGGYVPKILSYRKTAHPRNSEESQGYEETTVADTLNAFDNNEGRTPILVVQTLCFDESQITSPLNRNKPKWNDAYHSLTEEAARTVVIIKGTGECGEG